MNSVQKAKELMAEGYPVKVASPLAKALLLEGEGKDKEAAAYLDKAITAEEALKK